MSKAQKNKSKSAPKSDKSICVFCGSSPGNDPRYMELGRDTGIAIARKDYRLVYGGGGLGLMGASSIAAHEAGGEVYGIIPQFLLDVEKPPTGIEYTVVPDMHIRKMQMYDASDAFIVLPGGIGTLEECIEVLSWGRLNLHDKPMVFVDDNGYWDTLVALLDHIISKEFAPDWFREIVFTANTPEAALKCIEEVWDTPGRHSVDIEEARV